MLNKNKLCILWLFGFASGFTLMISGNTLNFWLASEKIDIRTIGVFAIISIPYAINFLWAPLFDIKSLGRFSRFIGHRLSWICLIQTLLGFSVIFISSLTPSANLLIFGCSGFIISLLGSAQDTVLGALRTEIITSSEQGAASGIYIFGYRVGMLLSSSFAIYLSKGLTWNQIYLTFGLFLLISPIILIFIHLFKNDFRSFNIDQTPKSLNINKQNTSCNRENFLIEILKPIGSFKFILMAVIFLILYRLPDDFINIMINPFLLHLGYSATQIATTGKFFGVVTAIIGGLLASRIMKTKPILDSLIMFGIIHACAHSLFIVQEIYGKNIYLLFVVISFESITGGMTMAAYIAFIASLCQGKFRATQYSFFTSMMGFSRSIFPAFSGYIVVDFGWRSFFAISTIATIPSLLLLFKISKKLKQNKGAL